VRLGAWIGCRYYYSTASLTDFLSAPIQISARRTLADIAVQIAGRFANLGLGVVVTLVIVRSLGASGFGVWSTVFAVSQIASNFGELGIGQVAVARAASDRPRAADWLGSLVTLRLLLAVPVSIASAIAVYLIAPTHDGQVAGVLISLTLLLSAPAALTAVFQLRVRNDISIALLTLNSILWAGAVLAIAAGPGGIVAFAAAFLAVSVVTTTVTVLIATRMLPLHVRGSTARWPELARVGITLGAAGILVTLYVKLDQVLVLTLAGSHEAGLYGADYRVLDQIQFIPASVMTTLFPLIASSYPENMERVRRLLQLTGEYLSLASLPILVFTIVNADSIVRILFGKEFAGAAPALPVLMGAFVSISFGYLVGNMVVIVQTQRAFLYFAALGLFINAALNLLLIPKYGFIAAAWITLLTEFTVMTLTARGILRRLDMRPALGRIARIGAAASMMGVLTLISREAGAPFIVIVAVAVVSYLVLIRLFRVISLAEVRAVLAKEPITLS